MSHCMHEIDSPPCGSCYCVQGRWDHKYNKQILI